MFDTNFGPKPFRWIDSLIDRLGCEDVVNYVLIGWCNDGPADLNLLRKLRNIRDKLKWWINECRVKENENEKSLKQEKEDMEWLMEQKDLDES